MAISADTQTERDRVLSILGKTSNEGVNPNNFALAVNAIEHGTAANDFVPRFMTGNTRTQGA